MIGCRPPRTQQLAGFRTFFRRSMTSPEFSVLLLAWNDVDPRVAVFGGAALPPTLPLVYQLAAQQPVLAVYPHLPEATGAEATPAAQPSQTSTPPATANKATSAEASADALATRVAMPGVQLLSSVSLGGVTGPAGSRIIGLDELPINNLPSVTAARALPDPENFAVATPAHSQWPTGPNAPATNGAWQAPAAPYLGAGAVGSLPSLPPNPALVPIPVVGPNQPNLPASSSNFAPNLAQPPVRRPAPFDEPVEEVGAAEATDIQAAEIDLIPDTSAPPMAADVGPPAPPLAPEADAPSPPTIQMPNPDGLNFRMIQYARQAAQLVQGRSDFGVIYAPNWPAWLAALEIRNSSGRPLVLYAASLAADFASPAERGWQIEIERMTVRRASLVLVPDAGLHRRLVALYGDTIGEVRVVAAADERAVQEVLREVSRR